MLFNPGLFSFGMDIIVSSQLDDTRTKQVRFPRSKRRRIRKKWRRNPNNWKTYRVPVGYMMGGTMVVNDLRMAELQEMMHLYNKAASNPGRH